jgi:hypothetical protein
MDYHWWAPTPLWQDLVTPSGYGCLCVRCFDRLAKRGGYRVLWTPMVCGRDTGTEYIPNSNWWLDDTRDALLMGLPDPEAFTRPNGEDGTSQQQEPWVAIRKLTGLPAAPVGGYGRG